ncbi:RlmE family RNA methyltransferase [Candidatus Finniella inopinata]|uniref:Ribosomal RNA large subunit methyltransferase E n=2 Tax=Candidatus Finniella inopinata TaxID=1696036 RepID=A0A4Q7DIA9_9PROT|nr:RlmE family RNA methyltransferase [Candidatus Finniella inopinata]
MVMIKPPANNIDKVKLKDKRERTASSRQWLLRQLNDPYVHKAKHMGYRSRAAFKLLEIDQKFKLLKPGITVIDLGAAPGGWAQVATQKVITTKKRGLIVAIDLQDIKPLTDITFLQGDFLDEAVQAQLQTLLPDKADVVLSDMAAPACGMTDVDHIRIMDLLENVYEFCLVSLKPGGAMVAKVLRGGAENVLLQKLKKSFTKVVHFKPPASRQHSSEMYVVCLGFRGAA